MHQGGGGEREKFFFVDRRVLIAATVGQMVLAAAPLHGETL